MKFDIQSISDILVCPKCSSKLLFQNESISCNNCTFHFTIDEGILLSNPENSITDNRILKEKEFYEEYPFPNYDELESPFSLISKAERANFPKQINDLLPFRIRILEAGCGTGQLTNYLSFSERQVIGTDLSVNSLKLGNEFKNKHSLDRSMFIQMNIFEPCFCDESFHLVISNGVLHHTPNPELAFQILTKLLKKHGYIIIGLYNKYGRLSTHIRRIIYNLTGSRLDFLDPHLRRKDISEIKKQMWFMDQYKNPHESSHTFEEVIKWFESNNIDFVSAIPEFDFGTTNKNIFAKQNIGTELSRKLKQLLMVFKRYNEGGFFVVIGRKRA